MALFHYTRCLEPSCLRVMLLFLPRYVSQLHFQANVNIFLWHYFNLDVTHRLKNPWCYPMETTVDEPQLNVAPGTECSSSPNCSLLIGLSRSRSHQGHWAKVIPWKMLIWLPGHKFNFVWGQGHKKGQGHTKVKVIPRSNCKCLTFYQQAGGGLRLKGILVLNKV